MSRPDGDRKLVYRWRQALLYDSDFNATVRWVAFAMSTHMDVEDGRDCYPSVELLERETALGRRTVQRSLGLLRHRGWLLDDGYELVQTPGGEQRVPRYRAAIPAARGRHTDAPLAGRGRQGDAPSRGRQGVQGAPHSPKGGATQSQRGRHGGAQVVQEYSRSSSGSGLRPGATPRREASDRTWNSEAAECIRRLCYPPDGEEPPGHDIARDLDWFKARLDGGDSAGRIAMALEGALLLDPQLAGAKWSPAKWFSKSGPWENSYERAITAAGRGPRAAPGAREPASIGEILREQGLAG